MRLDAGEIVHQYYALSGETALRIVPEKDNGKGFAISELFLLGEGETPAWVQQWQPTVEDADLMLLFAHPDDEVLFFGGTLPYYAGERQMQVLPCFHGRGRMAAPRAAQQPVDGGGNTLSHRRALQRPLCQGP